MNDGSFKFAKVAVGGYMVFAIGFFGQAFGLSIEICRTLVMAGGTVAFIAMLISMYKSRADRSAE